MFFQKKGMQEVFLTSDVERFGLIITALKHSNIPYATKTVKMGMQNRGTGVIRGETWENTQGENMYYI